MSLLNLPTEILQQIISIYWYSCEFTSTEFFDRGNSVIHTLRHQQKRFGDLALVCQRLLPLVQKQLFRDVVVSSNPWPGKTRFDRFNAVLRSSPLIRSYVESIRLTWFTDRWEVSDMVNGEILLQLQSLRDLVLETDSPGHCKVLDFDFLDTNPMPRLRSLELSGPRMTYEAALRLVQKPGLISLRLGRCEGYEVDRDRHLTPQTGTAGSSLEYLDTTDSVLLDIELRQLLSRCNNLATLNCNLPRLLPEEEGDRPLLWQYRIGVPASRQRLSYCLEPASVSLTNLTVSTVREDSREAPAPDLTFLVSLQRLKVDAACLWPKYITPKDQERKTFYKCLPPSLEDLEITFEKNKSTTGVFWTIDQAEVMARSTLMLRADEPARYEWIMSLARSKPDRLPYLRSIRLVECFPTKYVDDWHIGDSSLVEETEWEPPREVQVLFEEKGIQLTVVLRLRKELELILAPR